MSDQYEIRSIDQLLGLLDNGHFLPECQDKVKELQTVLQDHRADFGGSPKGSLSIKLDFKLSKHGDVEITGTATMTKPKTPAAKGVAYASDDGQLTLNSPLLSKMHVRDVDTDKPIRSAAE